MPTDESGSPRRDLLAILFADVCGYSRLMSADEERTRVRVSRSIGLMQSLIGDYGGEVVQVAGDGIVALFHTASQSLRFAVDVQREFRSGAVWSQGEEEIAFRIGINLGEVVSDEVGIQGHNLNIAARVQDLAGPGEICITEAVRLIAREMKGVALRPMGARTLKNIPEAVQVFLVEDLGPSQPKAAPERPRAEVGPATDASIAVLPLENLSGDPHDNHLCDGVTTDLISSLSRFRDVLVIARHSTFKFRSGDIGPEQIAARLGVRYVVTGGLQRSGRKVRIGVQLIEASTNRVVWSERFEGDLEDIFDFQDEVTAVIASRLSIQISMAEQARVAASRTDIQAYGLILRGRELNIRVAREANFMARRLFEQAAEIDPTCARSYAGMSRTHYRAWRFNWVDPPEPELDLALDLANQAIEVDRADSRGYAALGSACLYSRQHEQSLAAYERAAELNPNDADVLAEMGHAVSCNGDTERAVTLIKRAMRLNPYHPDWYLWHLGEAYFDRGDYEEAVSTLDRMNDKAEGLRMLTASHALLGNMEEARSYADRLMRSQPEFTLQHWKDVPPDRNPEPRERLIEGLTKAGLK